MNLRNVGNLRGRLSISQKRREKILLLHIRTFYFAFICYSFRPSYLLKSYRIASVNSILYIRILDTILLLSNSILLPSGS